MGQMATKMEKTSQWVRVPAAERLFAGSESPRRATNGRQGAWRLQFTQVKSNWALHLSAGRLCSATARDPAVPVGRAELRCRAPIPGIMRGMAPLLQLGLASPGRRLVCALGL